MEKEELLQMFEKSDHPREELHNLYKERMKYMIVDVLSTFLESQGDNSEDEEIYEEYFQSYLKKWSHEYVETRFRPEK